MKKKNLIACLCALFLLPFVFISCSEKDGEEEYRSYPPEFTDVTFAASDGGDVLRAGDDIQATAVQGKKGRLLNKTEYAWSIEGVEDAFGDQVAKTVVYDNESENPSATFSVLAAGRYKLVFTARYSISGQPQSRNGVVNIENGTVNYATSTLYYDVTVEKTFTVR